MIKFNPNFLNKPSSRNNSVFFSINSTVPGRTHSCSRISFWIFGFALSPNQTPDLGWRFSTFRSAFRTCYFFTRQIARYWERVRRVVGGIMMTVIFCKDPIKFSYIQIKSSQVQSSLVKSSQVKSSPIKSKSNQDQFSPVKTSQFSPVQSSPFKSESSPAKSCQSNEFSKV